MAGNGNPGSACALGQGRQQELEADQLYALVPQQMAMLPQVARPGLHRATVFCATPELGERRQRSQRAQDPIVFITHATAPATIGLLVIG